MTGTEDREKYRKGLERARGSLWGCLKGLFGARPSLEPSQAEDLEETLLGADVGVSATARVMDELRSALARGEATPHEVAHILRREVAAAVDRAPAARAVAARPLVVLVVGVNGSGKTTTLGKLACRLTREGSRVMVVAADTFRAAAAEQAAIWAQRAGAAFARGAEGADPAAVLHDALSAARSSGVDVVLVDTAGRLHTKEPLMKELEKMGRVAARMVAGAPHEVLLVLDATTGQNAVVQARTFTRAVGVTGLVITKMDGTAKGGVLVPIVSELGLPVLWVGMGEGVDDLLPFDPESYAENLVGEG